MRLDELLPDYTARERHERVIRLSAEEALTVALEAPLDAVTRTLFTLRGLPRVRSYGALFPAMRFEQLERTPTQVVFGAGGMPWRLGGGIRPFAQPGPGGVRMALALGAEDLGGGRTRLWTETRVLPMDDRARRAFRRYWFVVGPFSAIVRRRWLHSVSKR